MDEPAVGKGIEPAIEIHIQHREPGGIQPALHVGAGGAQHRRGGLRTHEARGQWARRQHAAQVLQRHPAVGLGRHETVPIQVQIERRSRHARKDGFYDGGFIHREGQVPLQTDQIPLKIFPTAEVIAGIRRRGQRDRRASIERGGRRAARG